MDKRDASTQTLKFQRLAKHSSYKKVNLSCEHCEHYWLHHEKEHLILYYYEGRKYCLQCRHGLDKLETLKQSPFLDRLSHWVLFYYSYKRFKCCVCKDVAVHHHLGDHYYGRIPVFVNAAVRVHTLCTTCYSVRKFTNSEGPSMCERQMCRHAYRHGCVVL